MIDQKRHVVVVCGYGCHLDTPLKPYLDRVVRFINKQLPDLVVFCGGYTQGKSAPGVSEASLMTGYVKEKLAGLHVDIVSEDGSYTTLENIREAGQQIRLWILRNVGRRVNLRITIFCEAHRAPLVIMLARHFMGSLVKTIDDITVETTSWERADPFKQVCGMIYDKLAIKFPWLGLAERARKKRLRRAKKI